MKLFKLFISIITSVLLFANVSLAEKWDMAITALSAVNIIAVSYTHLRAHETQ